MQSSNPKPMLFHHVVHYIGLPLAIWTYSQSMIDVIYTISKTGITPYLLIDVGFQVVVLLLAAISFIGFFWRGYLSWRTIILFLAMIPSYQIVILIFLILYHSGYVGRAAVTTFFLLILSTIAIHYYKARKSMFINKRTRVLHKRQVKAMYKHRFSSSKQRAFAIQRDPPLQLIEHSIIPCLQEQLSIEEVNRPINQYLSLPDSSCPFCGRLISSNGAKYCGHCGTKLPKHKVED